MNPFGEKSKVLVARGTRTQLKDSYLIFGRNGFDIRDLAGKTTLRIRESDSRDQAPDMITIGLQILSQFNPIELAAHDEFRKIINVIKKIDQTTKEIVKTAITGSLHKKDKPTAKRWPTINELFGWFLFEKLDAIPAGELDPGLIVKMTNEFLSCAPFDHHIRLQDGYPEFSEQFNRI